LESSFVARKAKIFVNGVLASTLAECINEKSNYLEDDSPIAFH
jgi:hypothetical protein